MKDMIISRLPQEALVDREILRHANEAVWEDVICNTPLLDASSLHNLRVVCRNCGCVVEQADACECIRGALRCPDCGEKHFLVQALVRQKASALRSKPERVALPVAKLPRVPVEVRRNSPPSSSPRASRTPAACVCEGSLHDGGYSDSMGAFEVMKGILSRKKLTEGRATRREYWIFVMFYFLCFLLFLPLFGSLTPAYIGVQTRRLHDMGKSGWWVFYMFLPLLILIVLFVLMLFMKGPIPPEFNNVITALLAVLTAWHLMMAFIVVFSVQDSQRGTNAYGCSYKYPA